MSGFRISKHRPQRHGNIFSRDSGSMLIHVHRENGLAHRTLSLPPWQVQVLRMMATKWFVVLIITGLASWVFFAVQTTRVPLLTRRISRMEVDARRLDTLQQALARLQQRYDQVQRMLSAPSASARVSTKGIDGSPARGPAVARPTIVAKQDSAVHQMTEKPKSDRGASNHPTNTGGGTKSRLP